MNNIQIFENQEFGAIRTMSDEQGDPLFCGKDVARALGYKKPENAVAMHVDRDDTLKQGVIDSLGREQFTTFINESALYSLILSSKLLNKNTLQEKLWKDM
jgi:prophage antirepressor-like protein